MQLTDPADRLARQQNPRAATGVQRRVALRLKRQLRGVYAIKGFDIALHVEEVDCPRRLAPLFIGGRPPGGARQMLWLMHAGDRQRPVGNRSIAQEHASELKHAHA